MLFSDADDEHAPRQMIFAVDNIHAYTVDAASSIRMPNKKVRRQRSPRYCLHDADAARRHMPLRRAADDAHHAATVIFPSLRCR